MDDEAVEILSDIRRWVKIIGIQEAKPVLRDALSDEDGNLEEDLLIIFHLTDGQHSTRDIADHVSFHHSTIADRQSEWADMGLVEKESQNDPYQRIISLDEAGIDVPEIRDIDGD